MDNHEEIVLLDYLLRARPLNHLALVFQLMFRRRTQQVAVEGIMSLSHHVS